MRQGSTHLASSSLHVPSGAAEREQQHLIDKLEITTEERKMVHRTIF